MSRTEDFISTFNEHDIKLLKRIWYENEFATEEYKNSLRRKIVFYNVALAMSDETDYEFGNQTFKGELENQKGIQHRYLRPSRTT